MWIALAFAVVLGLGVATLMLWLPSQVHAVELAWSERRAVALATAVGDCADAGLDFGDSAFVSDSLAEMRRFPDARYAVVLAEDGARLGAWGEPPP
ncbi:MAG: hypothetical protein ABMA64_27775, partial [Myxococcota bacterium]